MIQNIEKIIKKAKEGKYAIGQFNVYNIEWIKAVLETAQEQKSPAILATTYGAAKYMGGVKAVVALVNNIIEDLDITVPIALHLDHSTSYEWCKEAMDAGYKSVMFDGSKYNIKKNIEITEKVVSYAKKCNASVEGEVGIVGGEEESIVGQVRYASEEECISISKTGITTLAASLGSVHGHYNGEPKLGFDLMERYSKLTGLPLVLHGGSGIDDEKIKRAIECGQCKINVSTAIQEAFCDGLARYFEENKHKESKGYSPKVMFTTYSVPNVKEIVRRKMILFGSNGKG